MTDQAAARAAIKRERGTRHWTIPQWQQAAANAGRDWAAYDTEVQIAADAAVDALLDRIQQLQAALRFYRDSDAEALGCDQGEIAREALGSQDSESAGEQS